MSFMVLICGFYQQSPIRLFYELTSRGYYIEIIVGNPPQRCVVTIDLSCPFTRLTSMMYHEKSSLTNKIIRESTSIEYMDKWIKGNEMSDVIYIGDNLHVINSNLTFIQISQYIDFPTPNAIGFVYRFKNEEYSLIHQLKKNELIQELSFSFVKLFKSGGVIYLGGIPHESTVNKFKSFCNVDGAGGFWDCRMHQIIIDNHIYFNEEIGYSQFDPSIQTIEAPSNFESFLIQEYFKDIMTNQCRVLQKDNSQKYFVCKALYIHKLPNITFVIDKYTYSFESSQLFKCLSKECDLIISIRPHSLNWVFGISFLNQFDLSFNYDEKKIYFYSNHSLINEFLPENDGRISIMNFMKIILEICIIILNFGFVILLIEKRYIH